MKRAVKWTTALAISVLLTAACGGGGGAQNQPEQPTVPTETAEGTSVTIGDNFFEPSSVEVSEGAELSLTNDGNALHSFSLQDDGIDVDVQPGASTSVAVEVAPGEYSIFCKYHPEMTGTLTVS